MLRRVCATWPLTPLVTRCQRCQILEAKLQTRWRYGCSTLEQERGMEERFEKEVVYAEENAKVWSVNLPRHTFSYLPFHFCAL